LLNRSVVLKEDAVGEEGDALVISMTVHLFLDGLGVLEMQAGYGQSQESDEFTYFLTGSLEGYITYTTLFFLKCTIKHTSFPQGKIGLSVLTSNNMFSSSLFSVMTPEALLGWQRVRAAHALACIGKQWAQIFSKHNSGTYNNQYMVVDLKRVSLGRQIEDWSLTVVEQIPGLVLYLDQSYALPIISIGYWASYNIPFHSDIYRMSGYGVMWEKYGKDFSYDLCPRVKIFRRDQRKVTNLDTLKYIMRHNDYHMAQMFLAETVNGPTTQNGLPLFSWSHFNRTAHHGIPQTYNHAAPAVWFQRSS
uniref:Phospholipase B-like n=1 Tax=Cyprinus carpio carpio TaxID=630221 RepID=A0A9J8BLR4_CYPCA